MSNTVERIKFLITRRAEWCDPETDEVVEVTRETWHTAWALAGIHSRNWWWVRKWGNRECGCTINPLTRRTVLICWDHSAFGES